MHLKGNFEASFLASILQLLCNDKKTGVLRLSNDQNDVKIFIKEGVVLYAMGSQKESRLGYLLKSKGIISEKQLGKCLALAREGNQALGKILVKNGYISTKILKKIIQKQVKELIFSLFLWDKGYFEYNDAKINLKGFLVTPIDIMTIVLEATRRIDEMSILRKEITSEKLILKISEKVQYKEQTKFNAIEWRFLSLIDGKRTVRGLISASGYDDFTVYKVLYSLISFGFIEKAGTAHSDTDERGADYGAIIKAYHAILCCIHENLEEELGTWPFTFIDELRTEMNSQPRESIGVLHEKALKKWTLNIVEASKAPSDPGHEDVLRNFHLQHSATANAQDILESMKTYKDMKEGRLVLIAALNEFVGRFLNEIIRLIGKPATPRMLQAIRNILPDVFSNQLMNSSEEINIIDGIKDMVTKLEQKTQDQGIEPKRPAGVFAV